MELFGPSRISITNERHVFGNNILRIDLFIVVYSLGGGSLLLEDPCKYKEEVNNKDEDGNG
jgi:hypothetical protein